MRLLVTGGAGFIGSAVCRHLIAAGHEAVINVDALTYAGNLASLTDIDTHANYRFVRTDIGDEARIFELLETHRIEAIMHLAAESHVDRSIDGPDAFLQTNVVGTFKLLSAARQYWEMLEGERKQRFRFHHVSTDEVYGDLPLDEGIFTETTPYKPSSPYSASKAASDHFVRAWYESYGLPVIVTNCSNNYGPFHFPEKLIPLVILNALDGRELPIYGKGENVRDWLYVDDHARALEAVIMHGKIGETYNIGGRAERQNKDVVTSICGLLDKAKPRSDGRSYAEQISYVTDRPGHDRRYAIDPTKIETELGWTAQETFETGLSKTVNWYLQNDWWWAPIRERDRGDRKGTL